MNTKQITKTRLDRWKKRCDEIESTPQILIALNPDTGKLGLITTEYMGIHEIKALLIHALNNL